MEVDQDFFEHLLNCMANQKYIGEQSMDTQRVWQRIMDETWSEGMQLLTSGKLNVDDQVEAEMCN